MKFTESYILVGWMLLSTHLAAAAFLPALTFGVQKTKTARCTTADDGLPDIVKAYKKAATTQTEGSIPDHTISTNLPTSIIEEPVSTTITTTIPDGIVDVSAAVPSVVPDAPPGSEAVKMNFADEFLNAARANYQARYSAVTDSPRSPGEAPTLAEYIKTKGGFVFEPSAATAATGSSSTHKVSILPEYVVKRVSGNLPPEMSSSSLYDDNHALVANAKAKFGVMIDNAFHMFGGEGSTTASSYLPTDLSQGAAGWTVAAVAFLVGAGQRRAGIADASIEMKDLVRNQANVRSELQEQVKRMREELKELKTVKIDLRQELQATEDTLDERIVELWKEQEKLKDNERKCKDQIELLRCTLRERNAKKRKMVEIKRRADRRRLVNAFDKVKCVDKALRDATVSIPRSKSVVERGGILETSWD